MLATPSSGISNVLSCEPYSSACCAISPTLGTVPMVAGSNVPMRLTEVDDFLVDPGEGGLGVDGLGVLLPAVGAPHLAARADHRGHRRIHDDIARRMEVSDPLGRIDHRQFGAVLVAGVQVADDLVVQRGGQRLDLVVQVDQPVVDVDAELVEELLVFGERLLVEDLHGVSEDDRVRDLHHRRLDVQREHHAGLVRVFHLLFVEGAQGLLAHEHAVDDVALGQRHLRLEHDRLAALGDQLHLDVAGAVQRSSTSRRDRSRRASWSRRGCARPATIRPCCAGACARSP